MSGIQPDKSKILAHAAASSELKEARTSCVFHGPASLLHFVLLSHATTHEVHVARPVPLHLQRARLKRPLLSDEDMEVVVGGVEARVALCAERRTKDDKVLGDARVDDEHRTHRATSVVEHPFRAVRVDRYVRGRIGGGEIGEDVRDHTRCAVGRCGESGELQLVEMDWVEYVPPILSSMCYIGQRVVVIGMRKKREERTLIVSNQLNVASVTSKKTARVAHFVSGSHFWEVF